MEWYRQVQFIAAVEMPEERAVEYGTTVNGMWASPEQRPNGYVERAHARGERVLFSVPLIALQPKVYETSEHRHLLDEVCSDINGDKALVPWYYWEKKKVYSACIYSVPFLRYLMEICARGVDRGMDVFNLDEINTSIGLMDRKPGGSGFCHRCLKVFRDHVAGKGGADASLAAADDATLRQRLRDDDALYGRYRAIQEQEAFRVTKRFIDELRAYAAPRNPQFAITANVAYLGNAVVRHGDLWGPMWGEYLDFVMMENIYQPQSEGPHLQKSQAPSPHLVLPRGKFTAWYRLGTSFSAHAPVWICPSIMVPRQMAGEKRTTYYVLMFLEAYANGGRWGYYWWPGVDVETRMKATAPEELKDLTRFIVGHRQYYEEAAARNGIAVLYLNSSIRRRPETHDKYVALAQALAESGYQFDVLYGGDGIFAPEDLDPGRLEPYRTVLLPEAQDLSPAQARALEQFARRPGAQLVCFSPTGLDPSVAREGDGELLFGFWRHYREEDRQRIVSCLEKAGPARVVSSDPSVNVVRYFRGEEMVLHLLNYNYDPGTDSVTPSRGLTVTIPRQAGAPKACTLHSPDGDRTPRWKLSGGQLTVEVGDLPLYGLLVVG